MNSGFRGVARSMKDSALALALKTYFNERVRDYGEILACELNTDANTITLKVLLNGEDEPITVTVHEYQIERGEHARYVVLNAFSSSRPWLSTLLTRFVAGKRWPVPAVISRLL